MLSGYLLLHIYSALKEVIGPLITLEWKDSDLQVRPSAVNDPTPLIITDNQKVITN
jgi:hypothetical protein